MTESHTVSPTETAGAAGSGNGRARLWVAALERIMVG